MKPIDMSSIKEKLSGLKKIDMKKIDLKNFKFNKKIFFIIIIALIVLVVVARTTGNIQKVLFKKKSDIASKSKPITFEEDATAVKAYKIKRMDFKDTLPALGNIKGFKEVELKFQVPGVVESINFEEGEKIQEGDIIASLNQRDALLKLKYAEVELSKNKKLFELGAISSIKMEQSKLEYESAKSDLDKTNIYAVSNGLMGPKTRDIGSYFNPSETGDKVGLFINADKVYAEFNIIEKDVPKIALGQRVEVFVDAYPGKSFAGAIDRISPVIEGRSRTQTIKVELDNKEGILKPGMFVRALISTYEKKDALVIPASSLKKKENEYLAYVIHKEEPKRIAEAVLTKDKSKAKDKGLFGIFGGKKKEGAKPEASAAAGPKEKAAEYGTIEVRKIVPGYMSEDLVEVDKGVQEDELVVVEVQEEFKDKAKVEIAEVQEGIL
ncbi:MAG: efflux RND transporter periplasmic adaptor subunit [Candidatus Omnitrophica bacterium]|nr:efflux RND transporter periplasmic adaptor subunit [Candidatus Omnitrophota bacterium]